MTPVAPRIRAVTGSDYRRIQEIYAHHVQFGLASFEEIPPGIAEIEQRFDALQAAGYPAIVAEIASAGASQIVGYAYASAYRPRPAYRFTVEDSVYVDATCARQGIGSTLLEALIDRCTQSGFRQMIAVIGDPENQSSIGLHERHGFETVGTFRSIGFKHDRWVGSVVMQRALGDGDDLPPD